MRKGQTAKINKLEGIAVSPGIIVGKARLVDRSRVKILYQYLISDKQVSQEVERFKEALNTTKEQIIALKNGMPDQLKQHAFILDTQLMIMDDGMLSKSTIDTITKEKMNAEWALKKSIQKIRQLFQQIDDGYIKERINDVEYVAERVLRNLAGKEVESLSEITDRVIIVAHDLSPADTSEMNIGKVMGFITDVGGPTSHTAIMAQALEIPAVVGLESITQRVQDGVLLIVDGNSGEVIIDPDDDVIIRYQEKQLELERYRSSIDRISHLPAETLDGHRIAVQANLELLEEVVPARDHGAEGIGLYRTEFLYLRSRGVPSEKELFEDYKELAEIVAPAPVNIRTLDIGGDKFSSDLNLTREMNPALGLRAIRFCLKEPKIFKSQLRAILRASAYGQVRLLLPMISGLQEILDTKKILKEVEKELNNKKIKYARNIKVGIMIEIPSAVTMADALAKHVDFFSIGTNDLIQYALAIDRINEHVAYMYQPFHPAILKMIQHVVMAAKNAGIKVALCGEMAGDPLCAFILVGLGLDELSMNAQSIPMIKKIIRSISMKEAQADLEHIMQLETAKEVRKFIVKRMKPLISELDEKGYYIKVS
ncbi:MAG: phosphoenolpyruvate-protein phosphotransferase [Nitrospira bacterium SG8_3]|nr:MAG: phosphoenolpyruvate-protein phosphotransferase [Nitrospira bacterium SG8_3]